MNVNPRPSTGLLQGPVMIDIEGFDITQDEQLRLEHPATGGVILFRRNYTSPNQIRALIASIRAIRPTLLIAVDHEGGRVQRFRDGFTRLPPAGAYERLNDLELVEDAGWVMAAECLAVGVDFSFAPVLDVESGISQVIGDRAFGRDPATVSRLASAFVRGMRAAGMAAVGKHFPGHGGVVEDSHLALPVDHRTLEQLENWDLLPFADLIAAGIEGIMPAHVIYDAVNPQPAGFSSYWIQKVLREQLGFQGAIFSDDLSMAGAAFAGGPIDRAILALEAGCDMVLVCNAPGSADAVLEALGTPLPNDSRIVRLNRLRGHCHIAKEDLFNHPRWQSAAPRLQSLSEQ